MSKERADEIIDKIIKLANELIEIQKQDDLVLFVQDALDNNHMLFISHHDEDSEIPEDMSMLFWAAYCEYKDKNPYLRLVQ